MISHTNGGILAGRPAQRDTRAILEPSHSPRRYFPLSRRCSNLDCAWPLTVEEVWAVAGKEPNRCREFLIETLTIRAASMPG